MRIILLLMTLIATNAGAQNIVSGFISDKTTGEKLMYASIYIKDRNIGVVSDDHGYFKFRVPADLLTDSLVVSYMGYRNDSIPISKAIPDTLHIELNRSSINLKEVEITEDLIKLNTRKIGITKGKTSSFTNYNRHLHSTYFDLGINKLYKLQSFRIFIGSWPDTTTRLRLTIQNRDSFESIPFQILNKKDIIIQPVHENKWYEVDLNPYNIYIKESGFYATLEIINPDVSKIENIHSSKFTIGTKFGQDVPDEMKQDIAKQRFNGMWMDSKGETPMIGFKISEF